MINEKVKNKGFTLVELLAVIVILAVILVIAVPQIMNIIEDVKKASFTSTVKIIATEAEKKYVQDEVLGKENNIRCENISKLNKGDYKYCNISMDDGIALVTLIGSGKFEGMKVLNGTKSIINVVEDDGEELYTLEDVYEMANNLTTELEKSNDQISDNISAIQENKNNISNMIDKNSNENIFLKMYPVGSVYVNSTNTNPSELFGGEWELIDKRFKTISSTLYDSTHNIDTIMFTPTENLNDYGLYLVRTGNSLRIRLKLVPSLELNDGKYELGTLNYNNLGIKPLDHSIIYQPCASDSGDGIVYTSIIYDTGKIEVADVITKESEGEIPADSSIYCQFVIPIAHNYMLDSATGEFHFKRIA